MIVSLRHLLGWLFSAFRSQKDLVLENLALHQQVLALHEQRPRRRLTALHKLFWVALRMFWSGWRKPLVLVTPRSVVNWHRAGFRLYWTWISRFRRVGGRKRVSKEVRALIFRMLAENPTWGAPRIHGELLKLGFDLSERSVWRWIRRAPRDADPVKQSPIRTSSLFGKMPTPMFPSSSRPKWSMRRFNATSVTRTANHLECCTPSILTFRPLTGCELQSNWYEMGRNSLAGSTKTSIPW